MRQEIHRRRGLGRPEELIWHLPVTNALVTIAGVDIMLSPIKEDKDTLLHSGVEEIISDNRIHLFEQEWNIQLGLTASVVPYVSRTLFDAYGERSMDEFSIKCFSKAVKIFWRVGCLSGDS